MINTSTIGKPAAADPVRQTSHVEKRVEHHSAASSEFAKFLSDVLTKIEPAGESPAGQAAKAPAVKK